MLRKSLLSDFENKKTKTKTGPIELASYVRTTSYGGRGPIYYNYSLPGRPHGATVEVVLIFGESKTDVYGDEGQREGRHLIRLHLSRA